MPTQNEEEAIGIGENTDGWELSALLCLPDCSPGKKRRESEGGTRIIGIPLLALLSRDHRGINYFTEKEEERGAADSISNFEGKRVGFRASIYDVRTEGGAEESEKCSKFGKKPF